MISVIYSFPTPCDVVSDGLIIARNAIFQALFERAAERQKLIAQMDADGTSTFVEVSDLSIDKARGFLIQLDDVGMIAHIFVSTASEEAWASLSAYEGRLSRM